jgi:hypothetical protein
MEVMEKKLVDVQEIERIIKECEESREKELEILNSEYVKKLLLRRSQRKKRVIRETGMIGEEKVGAMNGVYEIKCLVNGKIYVGCSRDVHSRIRSEENKLELGGHPAVKLQRDWNEFGRKKFEITVIYSSKSYVGMKLRKQERVKELKKEKLSYNINNS